MSSAATFLKARQGKARQGKASALIWLEQSIRDGVVIFRSGLHRTSKIGCTSITELPRGERTRHASRLITIRTCRSRAAFPTTATDPKETSALRTATAAMQSRADIARVVSFVTDAALRACPRTAPWDDAPSRCRTETSSNSPSPTSSLISALPGNRNRRRLRAGAQPPLCSNRPHPRSRAQTLRRTAYLPYHKPTEHPQGALTDPRSSSSPTTPALLDAQTRLDRLSVDLATSRQ